MINPVWIRRSFVLLFLLGAGVRAIDLWRPADGTVRGSWREADTAGIARNYYREGMNLLYPRIDWRGDGPGYVETEFPILPWGMAAAYKVFGYHEVIGRIISYTFSLFTLAVFIRLAIYLLPTTAALVAVAFFVLSPLVIRISNAIQPEAVMFFCYVAAVFAFLRWLDSNSWHHYAAALIATAMAILAKVVAAHLGFVFVGFLVWKRGWGFLRDKRVWVFAIASLLPGILWYLHARGLWETYGNSLGISNEAHLIGLDFFRDREQGLGLLIAELYYVWMPTGLVVGLFALVAGLSTPAVRVALLWLAGIALYYMIFVKTLSAQWAVYYHVVSVPPAALLIGAGTSMLLDRIRGSRMWTTLGLGAGAGILVVSVIVLLPVPFGFEAYRFVLRSAPVTAALAFAGVLMWDKTARLPLQDVSSVSRTSPAALLALFAVPVTFIFQLRQIGVDVHPSQWQDEYSCAEHIAPAIPDNALIIASGGECTAWQAPAAYNESFMFFWTDKKGFNVCVQEQSIEKLETFVARGAEFFIAHKSALERIPGFERELIARYPVAAECENWYLFDLRSGDAGRPADNAIPPRGDR